MIPTQSTVVVEGDLMGEEVAMTFDEASLPFLMKTFIDLYSKPAEACVREYSTNALDSHLAAGQTRPIEVTTPNGFSSFLTIEDFGLGMNAESIRNTYSKFGASTKRNDNTQNGMLGLGSKAALTFTNAFNVTGILDGIETSVAVTRSENGAGVMEIISELPTDKPNGVKISIPMREGKIEKIVQDFFRFWKPGTVLVNGRQPEHITGTQIGDFLFVPNLGQDYVVMGNVAYPVEQEHRIFNAGGWYRDGVVAYVGMGEINFTPSREAIHMTSLSKATLVRLRSEFSNAAQEHVANKLENAATYNEAAQAYYELNGTTLRHYVESATYKGESIPRKFQFNFNYERFDNSCYSGSSTNYRTMVETDCVIMEDYPFEKVHSTHRAKLRTWLDNEGISPDHVYFAEDSPTSPWLAHIPRVKWDTVKAIKLVKTPKQPKPAVDKYDFLTERGNKGYSIEVDTTKTTLIYASNAEITSNEVRERVAKFLIDEDTQFLLVNKNRWKKFKQDHPTAVHFMDEIKRRVAEYQATLSDADKLVLKSDRQDRAICARLDASRIDDPELSAKVESLGGDGTSGNSVEVAQDKHANIAYSFNLPFVRINPESLSIFADYPMMEIVGWYRSNIPVEHVYAYLNGAYRDIYQNN